MTIPEGKLSDTLFAGLTEEEAKYLSWLMDRVDTGEYTPRQARELFKWKYPNSKWLPENE